MVSDSELVDRLREILRESDLETATAASVRRRLEEEFSIDLYSRRAFVREQIDIFLQGNSVQGDAAEAPQNRHEDKLDEEGNGSGRVDEQSGGEESGSGSGSEDENAREEISGEEEEEKRSGDKRSTSRKRKSTTKDTDVKKKGGGFTKPCALSPQLQDFLGVPHLARTEVVKKIWEYIREKDLQNPKDKRKILCDETLQGIFHVNSIDMFQMNKALTKHIWPLDEVEAATVKVSQSQKQQKQSRETEKTKVSKRDEPKKEEKLKKVGTSGLTAPLPVSDALMKFFGTGEREFSRTDVIKRMWQYIKENELQDPSDKRMILCDDKLKELFEVDTFRGFAISKLLTSHFIKPQE